MSNPVIKWSVRLVSTIAGLAVVLSILAVIVLANIGIFAPTIVAWVNDATDYNVAANRIDLELFAATPTLRIEQLELTHEGEQANLSFVADQIEVQPVLDSILSGQLQFERIQVLRPRISGKVMTVEADGQEGERDDTPVSGIAALAKVRQMSVEQGELDIAWELDDSVIELRSSFELSSFEKPDGIGMIGSAKTKLYSESTLDFQLDVVEGQDGRASQADLQVAVTDFDLAWLKFANIPRLPLGHVRTVVSAEVDAQWLNGQIIFANWDINAQDRDLAAGLPEGAAASIASSGGWRPDGSGAFPGSGSVEADLRLQGLDFVALMQHFKESFPEKFHRYMSNNLHSMWVPELNAAIQMSDLSKLELLDIKMDGTFSNLHFNYGKNMPPIENGAGEVSIRGTRFESKLLEGTVAGLVARDVNAVVENVLEPEPDLFLSGNMVVPIPKALELFGSEGSARPGKLRLVASGEGEVLASADFVVPMRKARTFTMSGSMDLNGATAVLENGATLSDLQGVVEFGRYGLLGGSVAAMAFGGRSEAVFTGAAEKDDWEIVGSVSGTAKPETMSRVLGPALPDYLRGTMAYRSSYEVRKDESDILISSELAGVEVSLPAPIKKAADAQLPVRIEIRNRGREYREIDIDIEGLLSSSARMSKASGKWSLVSATAGVGVEKPEHPADGVSASIATQELDLQGWSELTSAGAEREDAMALSSLQAIDVAAGTMVLPRQRRVDNVKANFLRTVEGWQMELESEDLQGVFDYRTNASLEEPPELIISMSKCRLPQSGDEITRSPVDPTTIPTIIFSCDDTKYGKYKLGKARFRGVPVETGWKIENARFESEPLSINATGIWELIEGEQRTRLDLDMTSSDFGLAMEDLGYENFAVDGTAKLTAALNWNDALTNWSPGGISGEASFRADDGVILDFDSAGAKLLSLLDFGSLRRRLSLDFRDTFQKGFEFEKIRGSTTLDSGIVKVEGLTVEGSGADMAIAGTSDWGKETHDLTVLVEPQISSAVPTLVTTIAGLPAGILAYLLQKRSSKDEKILRAVTLTEYRVTGPWSDAKVELVKANAAQ